MKCRFYRVDYDRIERLTRRARKHIRATTPTCKDVPRAVIVRALLRQGFELVETRELVATYPSATEPPIAVSYKISPVDSARLAQVCDLLKGRSFIDAPPTLPDVQRLIIRLALDEAESRASFPGFMVAVLGSWRSPGKQAP
jgi:DNA-binding transcriptional MerR regulator